LLPEEYPEHYECRYLLNGYLPKAFHLANDGENRLLLSIFPAATSGNYTHYGYFGEVDHLIPWQIDHQISWRPVAKSAVEALSKLINKKYNYR